MLTWRGPTRINESNSCLCAGHPKNPMMCLGVLSKLTVHVLSHLSSGKTLLAPQRRTLVGQGFGSVYKSKRLFTYVKP